MNSESPHLERAACQVTGANVLFERMVDALLTQMRSALGVPSSIHPDDPVHNAIELEFAQARTELTGFEKDFQETYSELLAKHVGSEHFGAVVQSLRDANVQRYLSAVSSMEPELLQLMESIGSRMARHLCSNES
jgi:hypothetical protein